MGRSLRMAKPFVHRGTSNTFQEKCPVMDAPSITVNVYKKQHVATVCSTTESLATERSLLEEIHYAVRGIKSIFQAKCPVADAPLIIIIA